MLVCCRTPEGHLLATLFYILTASNSKQKPLAASRQYTVCSRVHPTRSCFSSSLLLTTPPLPMPAAAPASPRRQASHLDRASNATSRLPAPRHACRPDPAASAHVLGGELTFSTPKHLPKGYSALLVT